MSDNTIKLWEISNENGAVELGLPDQSSLDALTRQLSSGFYTTFRTFDGGRRVLGLKVHLQRLYQPAALQNINSSLSEDKLRQSLAGVLETYHNDVRIRVILTSEGQVYLAIEPLKLLPREVYEQGVKVITTELARQNPRLKSTAFISASKGTREQIVGSAIFEALLVRKGMILEGMTSNFFYIMDGKVGTARDDILLGVTRRTVLRIARGCELEILYRPLKLEQVPSLDEAFLTSSSRGIVPIVQIDDAVVGEGRPGAITKQLMKAYNEYVLTSAEKI